MKLFKRISIVLLVLVVLLEITLRLYGLGNPVLYIEDADYEYIYAPNQDVKRFGNHIVTNEFGMRSKPINKNDSIVVLIIGDSVLNGGTQVDQDSLTTTILENSLSEKFKQTIRVLNISAGSWGPDNAVEFIKKHGTFNSFLLVFVFSSHDYHDPITHKKVVGILEAYPSKKPTFAISELINRYLLKSNLQNKSKTTKAPKILREQWSRNLQINKGWNQIVDLKNKNIGVIGYIHPMKSELEKKQYNTLGNMLISKLEADSVEFITGMNYMVPDAYRDDIHTNAKGHRILSNALEPIIEDKIKANFFSNKTLK
ncbi:MAG: hypothetical protein V4667_05610 [Bacteroidota bacterium]